MAAGEGKWRYKNQKRCARIWEGRVNEGGHAMSRELLDGCYQVFFEFPLLIYVYLLHFCTANKASS